MRCHIVGILILCRLKSLNCKNVEGRGREGENSDAKNIFQLALISRCFVQSTSEWSHRKGIYQGLIGT